MAVAVWAGLAGSASAGRRGAQPDQAAPRAVEAQAAIPPLRPEQTSLLLKALDAAEAHGFRHGEFVSDDLAERSRSADPGAQEQLKNAVLAYARAQRGLRLPKSAFLDEWGMRPAAYDPAPEFAQAVAQNRVREWLASLPPPYEGYRGLRQALIRYRQIEAGGAWRPVSASSSATALHTRLGLEDPEAGADALRRFQLRHGLSPSGVLDQASVKAMNVPVSARIHQIEANMERWRWVPRQIPATRVQVNIAAASLDAFQDNEVTTSMRAVAGRPADQTPMLQSEIQSIVFNPAWHVPDSIAKKEIWPKAHRNPGYFARENMMVVHDEAGGSRIVQRPGPKNSLGQIKFDFPNRYGVYLHDTPVRATFARSSRMASHGCVRLEHPQELAKLLLRDDPSWTQDRIDQTVASEDTTRARLPHAVPVFIFYWTAFADPGGAASFRPDPYGWDEQLTSRLRGQSV